MEDDATFCNSVQQLHRNGEWQAIIQLYEQGSVDTRILWYQPSFEAVDFVKENLSFLRVQGVTSIGCGTGLLEWIIQLSTGLPVEGYDIDEGWWQSKYSPPKFLAEMKCIDEEHFPEMDADNALLFCYFNNLAAFSEYLEKFKGRCVILIGPDEGNARHCDPSPFYLAIHSSDWRVHQVHRNAYKDAIVVYTR